MMRPVRYLLSAMMLVFWTASVFAQNIGIFPGRGEVKIGKNSLTTARILARREALKDAVSQALSQSVSVGFLKGKQKLIDSRILKKPDKYAQSYEIVSAGPQDELYVMRLEARINLDLLIADVRALEAASGEAQEKRRGVLVVAVSTWQDEETPFEKIEIPLRKRLAMTGLVPLDGDLVSSFLSSEAFNRVRENRFDLAYDFGMKNRIHYLLVIRANVLVKEGAGCPASAKVVLLDVRNRKVLAQFDYGFPEEVGCTEAANEGAKAIFSRLTELVSGEGVFEDAPLVAVELNIAGLKNYQDATKLTVLLKTIPDVKQVALQSFGTGGRMTYLVKYEGRKDNLIEAIEKLKPVGYSLSRKTSFEHDLYFEAEY